MICRFNRLALGVAVVLMTAACSSASQGPQLRIVATTGIVGDMVASLVGDDGTVEVLVPPDVDPVSYLPTVGQVEAMKRADLVVAVGGGYEKRLAGNLRLAGLRGALLELVSLAEPLTVGDHPDPHVWYDPLRMALAATQAAEALAGKAMAADVAVWRARGSEYANELQRTNDRVAALLSPLSDATLVSTVPGMEYLGDRYGLSVRQVLVAPEVGAWQPTPDAVDQVLVALKLSHRPVLVVPVEGAGGLGSILGGLADRPVPVARLLTVALSAGEVEVSGYPDFLIQNAVTLSAAGGE